MKLQIRSDQRKTYKVQDIKFEIRLKSWCPNVYFFADRQPLSLVSKKGNLITREQIYPILNFNRTR